MDLDEYKALRKQIQDKAEADVAALDRIWELLKGQMIAVSNGKPPAKRPAKAKVPIKCQIEAVIKDIVQPFSRYDVAKKIDIPRGTNRQTIPMFLNKLARQGVLIKVSDGITGTGGKPATYRIKP